MKILLAKPGLDGHDVGVKVLAHALTEAGHKVVYTGLRKSVEDIIAKAIRENVEVIGLSVLSGTHLVLCLKMYELMTENNLDTPWIIGGNIPSQDVDILEKSGATKAFATGTKIETVVAYIKSLERISTA
jgi:methylmalonyl-CoA mutase, C-terminal domain